MTITFGYERFPIMMKTARGQEIMVCSACGYPVGVGHIETSTGKRKSWHCFSCQKWLKGGSTNTVTWIVTKKEGAE